MYRILVDAIRGCNLIFHVGADCHDDASEDVRVWLKQHPSEGGRVFMECFNGAYVGRTSQLGIMAIAAGRGATMEEKIRIQKEAGPVWAETGRQSSLGSECPRSPKT